MDVVELLFSATLQRAPTDWEKDYWRNQIEAVGLESTLRTVLACDEHASLRRNKTLMFVPAGHFYSPIVDCEFIGERREKIFEEINLPKSLSGIDINEQVQLDFTNNIRSTVESIVLPEEKTDGLRYYCNNSAFKHGDAAVYATMIRTHRPKRIFETGAGFSSALALDICQATPDYDPELRFIDPYPALARQLAGDYTGRNVTIEEKFIQDVDPAAFDCLEAGDFYFMDTTHIVKTGSDVLYHFENILPRLKPGVIIHVHDIFYPFEYPSSWVLDMKLSWNEIYYFRAFLAYNQQYEILFFNDFMTKMHAELMRSTAPLFELNGGASIWLRKK